jgi:hypothetical protein
VKDEEWARRRRVVDRAVYGIAATMTRYRVESAGFIHLVNEVESWIGSMTEAVDGDRLEAWRSEGNRLELVNASMIDEGRTIATPEEVRIVDAALAALDELCRPWTTLDDLEVEVLEMLVAGDAPSMRRLQGQVAVCRVRERERSGAGFFTKLRVDPSKVEPIDVGPARLGDVVAEIEGLQHGAGFILWIAQGYLDMLEAYSFDEPWPDEVGRFSLAYTEEPRDLTILGPSEDSAPAVHHDPRDVVTGNQEERGERPHEG